MRALVAAVLCIASPALATPRFTRSPAPAVPVHHDPPRAAAVAPAAPTETWDAVAGLGLTIALRADQVKLFEDLIAQTDDNDPDKPGYWFQLAETHAEQHRYWRLEAERLAIAGEDSTDAAANAKSELVAAVKTYQALLRFDDFANRDRALFLFGYLLDAGHYAKESRSAYRKLVEDYPTSPYVADAHLAFGDHDFALADSERDQAKDHLTDAAVEYKAVIELSKKLAPYARYKLGWVAFDLGEHEDALADFYQVAGETKGDLHESAAHDLVRAYAEIGKVDKAYRYFQKVDKKLAFGMFEQLADLYAGQGKAEKAITAYRALIAIDGAHPHVCDWHLGIARQMLTAGNRKDQIDALADVVALFGKKTRMSKDDLAICREDGAGLADDLTRGTHAEWAKTLDPDLPDLLERLYRLYLDGFPKADDHAEMAYYHANFLWTRAQGEATARLAAQRWDDAAIAFGEVVRAHEVGKKELTDAAEAAVEAWINAEAIDPRALRVPAVDDDPGAPPSPVPLPDREQRLLAAIADYQRLATPDPDVLVEMTFTEANVYRRYDHLDEAIAPLTEIVTHHREHARGPVAIDLLLHSLNRLGRHDEMLTWVDKLLGDAALAKREPELTDRLHHLAHQAKRKAAEACEAAADGDEFVACGQAYVALYNDDPDAADGDELVWNAALDLERGRSIGSAIGMYEQLVAAYPKSKLAARALVKLGDDYARIAWYRESAAKLEVYAKTYGGEADAFTALDHAVSYRKGIGDDTQAIADTRYLVGRLGGKNQGAAADAMYSLVAIYEKQGDLDAVTRQLRAYLSKFGKRGGVEREVAAYARLAEVLWQQACPVSTVDGSCVKVVHRMKSACGPQEKERITVVARDRKLVLGARAAAAKAIAAYPGGNSAKPAYARARFVLAEDAFEGYLGLAFPGNLDFSSAARSKRSLVRFTAWVKARGDAGAKARKQYEALVYDVRVADQAIASAARVGQIAQSFAAALYTAPIPSSVQGDDARDAYCTTLGDKAAPFEEKAIDDYRACLDESTKLGWFSGWSRLCERELGALRPDQYPTAAEVRASPDAIPMVTMLEQAEKLAR